MYISKRMKFILTLCIAIVWVGLSFYLCRPWFFRLNTVFPTWLSVFALLSLAILPGLNCSLILGGVLFDKPRDYTDPKEKLPDVTILIAAYNEENAIYETLSYLNAQHYNGTFFVKVIDNNSTDNTKNEIYRAINDLNIPIEYLFEEKAGKFNALNKGLETTSTPYVITLDADTVTYKNALNTLVNHIFQEGKNKKVGAVAGSVLVRNSRENLMTKLQEWEYFITISGIKRAQGLFNSTLVTQGACSIFDTVLVKKIGGWKDSIGEDIVLTWDIMAEGYMTQFEPEAFFFTNVPTTYRIFRRQRSRWSRGLIEALRQRAPWKYPDPYQRFHILADYIMVMTDFGLCCIWEPGLIIALLFHNYLIVGPYVFLLVPLIILMHGTLFLKEYNRAFKKNGLKVRKHWGALIVFAVIFSWIVAPAAVIGYVQELLKIQRRWK